MTITFGDLIAALTVGISAFAIWRSLRKDREERMSDRADKVRFAAARALTQLDRWQLLNLGLYEQLQSVFVSTSEMLTQEFDIVGARDHLWRRINEERTQIRKSVANEKIPTSYVDLLPHFPFWRDTFRNTLQELDAIEEYIFWRLLVETQSDVHWFHDRKDSFESADLGNALRSTAEEFRQELIDKSDDRISPLREYLEGVIVQPDTMILERSADLPSEISEGNRRVQYGNGKLLWLGANPRDSIRLNIKKEIEEIRQSSQKAPREFTVVERWAVSADELQALLMKHRPSIIHLSGHGNQDGEIELHSQFNVSRPVPEEAITALFKLLGHDVQCVFLNACYSQGQGESIANHVGCVVGMSDAVADRTAIEFSSAFYDALSHGESFRNSFDIALNRLNLKEISGDEVPVFIDPFGRGDKLYFYPEQSVSAN